MARIWDLNKIPYLEEQQYFDFQVISDCADLIAVGGNLSPGLLISAYRQGLYPCYSKWEPIHWWSRKQRFVLFPDELHLPKSLLKNMKRNLSLSVFGELEEDKGNTNGDMRFSLSLDQAFANVIKACAQTFRPSQSKEDASSWLNSEMQDAYIELHRLGYAHSVECWLQQADGSKKLVGGLYGISLGRAQGLQCFYGESMFSHVADASKTAFAALVLFLREKGFYLIDCQQETKHLRRFGARLIAREEFEQMLEGLDNGAPYGWGAYRKEFPLSPSLSKLLGR